MQNKYDIPILLIIFKRKELTKKLFEKIRKIKPSKLYITADGPRNKDEELEVQQTREVIKVDWDCDVHYFFHEKNLGVAKNPIFGISQMLKDNEYGIILEDDVLPSESFFKFMEIMLKHYKDDDSVGFITGINPSKVKTQYSYFFVNYAFTYGWATWQRVWKDYDFEIKKWSEIDKISWLKERFSNPLIRMYWYEYFNRVYGGSKDAWDYQFSFLYFDKKYKIIVPSKNLSSHTGTDNLATHRNWLFRLRNLSNLEELEFPIKHPPEKEINKKVENYFYNIPKKLMLIKLIARPFKYWPILFKVL